MVSSPCTACGGKRLKPEALAVLIRDKNIADVSAMSVEEALHWVSNLEEGFSEREKAIAKEVIKELHSRIGFWRMLVLITLLWTVLRPLYPAVRGSV